MFKDHEEKINEVIDLLSDLIRTETRTIYEDFGNLDAEGYDPAKYNFARIMVGAALHKIINYKRYSVLPGIHSIENSVLQIIKNWIDKENP